MTGRNYLAWGLLICLALSATPLAAEDVFPTPWSSSLLNQTVQVWDATVSWIPNAAIGANLGYQNDYGWPGAWFGGDWDSEDVIGQRGEEIPTYHVADEGCYLLIHIPNHNEDNPLKMIHWQITADQSVTPGDVQPTSDPTGTATAGPTKDDWGVGTWCTYSGMLEIRPNPDEDGRHDGIFFPTSPVGNRVPWRPVPYNHTFALRGAKPRSVSLDGIRRCTR